MDIERGYDCGYNCGYIISYLDDYNGKTANKTSQKQVKMRSKNISERIQLVLNDKKLSIRAFSRMINCADTTIGAILRGKVEPNYTTIFSILETFKDISPEWLITGEGDMYIRAKTDADKSQEELYLNHVKQITKIVLKKLEEFTESTSIEKVVASVYANECHSKGKRNRKNITSLTPKN